MRPILLPYYSHKKTQLCGKIMGLGVSSLGAPICRGGFALPNAAWVVIMTWSSQRLIPTDALQSKSLVVWIAMQTASVCLWCFSWHEISQFRLNQCYSRAQFSLNCIIPLAVSLTVSGGTTYSLNFKGDTVSNQSFCWITEEIAQSSDKIIQPRMQLMLELSSCGEALALPITQGAPEHDGKTW